MVPKSYFGRSKRCSDTDLRVKGIPPPHASPHCNGAVRRKKAPVGEMQNVTTKRSNAESSEGEDTDVIHMQKSMPLWGVENLSNG